jgi:hypothetical protein
VTTEHPNTFNGSVSLGINPEPTEDPVQTGEQDIFGEADVHKTKIQKRYHQYPILWNPSKLHLLKNLKLLLKALN